MQGYLENSFHREMAEIYQKVAYWGYNASYFRQMLTDNGGLQTAKILLHKPGLQYGFTALWEMKRLDLSMEALVIRNPWKTLFTEDEIKIAKIRLRLCGYSIPDEN